jgi:hypothetical protein
MVSIHGCAVLQRNGFDKGSRCFCKEMGWQFELRLMFCAIGFRVVRVDNSSGCFEMRGTVFSLCVFDGLDLAIA